ncbi:MAG: prepilin-type N-terminal cleavage/methylation domain-containing protein [Verrucomicrobia bacterium]|nr:prepilin-type N-terminal cleavage/methylation domain-containing protein [Verrucomicrobiota bacterium]
MNRRHKTDGFSLVEVMCAILIFGLSVVGLTRGLTAALLANKESEVQTSAALIAAGRIELLRADGFLKDGEDEGDCGANLPLYRWKQSVTETSVEGLFEVTVMVANAESGKPIFELETLLFEAPYDSSADNLGGSGSQSQSNRQRRRP